MANNLAGEFYISPKLRKVWESGQKYVVAYGGRGSGKSLQMAALVIRHALTVGGSRILCVRGTQSKISESSLQTLKDVISLMGLDSQFEQTEHTLECKNGSKFLFYGAKNYMSFKSLQGINLVWVDEATELSNSAWEILIPTPRDEHVRFFISFNPESIDDWVQDQFITNKRPNAAVCKMNFPDNPFFPKTLREEMLIDRMRNPANYKHTWEGELLTFSDDAIFKPEWLSHLGVEDEMNILKNMGHNIFDKIVVAIDPSGSDNEKSDACGIVVVAKYKHSPRFCILQDKTKIMRPAKWADVAINTFKSWDADCIIYEKNYGGLMCEDVIRVKDPYIPIYSVNATKGKDIRAESIQFIYEKKMVDHLSGLNELEAEMVTWAPGKGLRSPNRLDALVWGLKHFVDLGSTDMSAPMTRLSI